MLSGELFESLKNKQFFKLTGTPEHWLTAVKFKTWGLKESSLAQWQHIEVGDLFFMHSTKGSEFKNTKPKIIGLGIVGTGIRQKTNLLWQEEFEENRNIYPLLVPFSEIYLFSDLPDLNGWDPLDRVQTQRLIDILLSKAIDVPTRFNVMGSMSSIQQDVGLSILHRGLPEHEIDADFDSEAFQNAVTPLVKVKKSIDTLRFVPTLKYLNSTKPKETSNKEISVFERNNELLDRANVDHQRIIDEAIAILQKNGFETFSNLHVDLVAENEKSILLFEAKSLPENKFRMQARTAVGQLYQYEFFDVGEHQKINNTDKPVNKILLLPHDPSDHAYVNFLSWAKVTTQIPSKGSLLTL